MKQNFLIRPDLRFIPLYFCNIYVLFPFYDDMLA